MPSSDSHCAHCGENRHWVSHGYIYKRKQLQHQQVAGKRILCSNRYGHQGCGRTRQLYLADVIPGRHYGLSVVIAFLQALFKGRHVEQAYLGAIDPDTRSAKAPRQAWRWIKGLVKQLGRWRTLLVKPLEDFVYPGRSLSLKLLLPTLDALTRQSEHNTLATCQCHFQCAFF